MALFTGCEGDLINANRPIISKKSGDDVGFWHFSEEVSEADDVRS
jgi:hypothetical protein